MSSSVAGPRSADFVDDTLRMRDHLPPGCRFQERLQLRPISPPAESPHHHVLRRRPLPRARGRGAGKPRAASPPVALLGDASPTWRWIRRAQLRRVLHACIALCFSISQFSGELLVRPPGFGFLQKSVEVTLKLFSGGGRSSSPYFASRYGPKPAVHRRGCSPQGRRRPRHRGRARGRSARASRVGTATRALQAHDRCPGSARRVPQGFEG